MAITISSFKQVVGGGKPYDFQIMGESTDQKPCEVNGNPITVNSLFFELDTGDFYYMKSVGGGMEKVTLIEEQTVGEEGNA